MFNGWHLLGILVLLASYIDEAVADDFVQFDEGQVLVCPTQEINDFPPDPKSANCKLTPELQIDPHEKTVWLFGSITPSQALLQSDKPVGLFVSAKAASKIFLNGEFLASNGRPSLDLATETPGQIDVVFFVKRDQLKPGPNEIAILMSGRQSWIKSTRPVLTLGFFIYLEPPHHERDYAWLSLLTFGAFIVFGLYAAVLAWFRVSRIEPITLAVASFMAAGQVIAEPLRSLWSYPYPIHDLRLFFIILFGAGVGFALLAHTLRRFEIVHWKAILSVAFVVTGLCVWIGGGFDIKASLAILIPNLFAGIFALTYGIKGNRAAQIISGAFIVFVVVNLLDPGEFLDTNYFLGLAFLILILTVYQAVVFRNTLVENVEISKRRKQLELIIEKTESSRDQHLLIKHAGRAERINCSELSHLQAAGDYVILNLINGREIMHTGTLAALEEELPGYFLRIHRSHCVNTNLITSLKSSLGGTGEVHLSTGTSLPVSRRIMPSVKGVLSCENGIS